MPRTATTPTGLAFLTALDTALRENPPPFRDTPLLRRLAPIGVGPGLSPVRVGLTPAVLQALVASVDRTAPALPAISKQKVIQEALADAAGPVSATTSATTGPTTCSARRPPSWDSAPTPGGGLSDRADCHRRPAARRRERLPAGVQAGPGTAESRVLVADALQRERLPGRQPSASLRDRRHPSAAAKGADGSVVVLIQRSRPSGVHLNWLPSPSGGVRLTMRIYWPRRSVLDGRWQPPPIDPVG
jgi:hypothetical protein